MLTPRSITADEGLTRAESSYGIWVLHFQMLDGITFSNAGPFGHIIQFCKEFLSIQCLQKNV